MLLFCLEWVFLDPLPLHNHDAGRLGSSLNQSMSSSGGQQERIGIDSCGLISSLRSLESVPYLFLASAFCFLWESSSLGQESGPNLKRTETQNGKGKERGRWFPRRVEADLYIGSSHLVKFLVCITFNTYL